MQELGIEAEWRWYDKAPLGKRELESLIGDRPVADFLNPRSTPYKAMGLAGRKISKPEAVRLMLEDQNLLKRPLLVKGGTYIFGLDEAAYRKL